MVPSHPRDENGCDFIKCGWDFRKCGCDFRKQAGTRGRFISHLGPHQGRSPRAFSCSVDHPPPLPYSMKPTLHKDRSQTDAQSASISSLAEQRQSVRRKLCVRPLFVRYCLPPAATWTSLNERFCRSALAPQRNERFRRLPLLSNLSHHMPINITHHDVRSCLCDHPPTTGTSTASGVGTSATAAAAMQRRQWRRQRRW